MNHSSILQIHLNGGENSLSSGEHSIRIFSSPSLLFFVLFFFFFVKGAYWSKNEIKAQATGVRSEKLLESPRETGKAFRREKADLRCFRTNRRIYFLGQLKVSRSGRRLNTMIYNHCSILQRQLYMLQYLYIGLNGVRNTLLHLHKIQTVCSFTQIS